MLRKPNKTRGFLRLGDHVVWRVAVGPREGSDNGDRSVFHGSGSAYSEHPFSGQLSPLRSRGQPPGPVDRSRPSFGTALTVQPDAPNERPPISPRFGSSRFDVCSIRSTPPSRSPAQSVTGTLDADRLTLSPRSNLPSLATPRPPASTGQASGHSSSRSARSSLAGTDAVLFRSIPCLAAPRWRPQDQECRKRDPRRIEGIQPPRRGQTPWP